MLVDGSRRLHVLYVQTDRATGHGVLRFAQEKSTDLVPASLPSFFNADLRLDRCEVRCWWSFDPPWPHQLLVYLLHAGRIRAAYAEVSLVEKVPDYYTDHTIYHSIFPQFPNAVYQLQLPQAAVISARD